MEPLVSILVPVWGTEKYIEECLLSLVNQTMERIEIILVDDCSPDHAMEVAQRVADENPRREIRLIRHERNKGAFEARKTAVAHAKGRFLIHVDSDDWIDPGMCERLYGVAERRQADAVVSDAWFEYPGRRVYSREAKRGWERMSPAEAVLGWYISPHLCIKMFSRELYDKAGPLIEPGYNFSEDFYLNAHLFYFAEKVAYLPEAFYHYRISAESSMGTLLATPKKGLEAVENMKLVEKFYLARPDAEKYAASILFAKLFAKKPLALTTDRAFDELWLGSFPEADAMIWRNRTEKLQYKLVEWLLHKHMFRAKNLLLRVLDSGKRMAGMGRR